jgi:hypothetical protein
MTDTWEQLSDEKGAKYFHDGYTELSKFFKTQL